MARKKNYVLKILFGENGVSVGARDFETDSDSEAENTFNSWVDGAKRNGKNTCSVAWYVYSKDEDGYLEETQKQFAMIRKQGGEQKCC